MDFGIPSNWRVPGAYTEFDVLSGSSGIASVDHKVLLVGQYSAGGTVNGQHVPKEIFGLDEAATNYGTKTPLYLMARAWFRANKNMSVWCLPVPDRSSDVATKPTIVVDFGLIDAPSAGEGKYIVAVANNTYTITATNWADFKSKFDLALAGDLSQPMESTWSLVVAVPRLTLTPANYGQVFDSVDVRFIQVPSSVTVAEPVYTPGSNSPLYNTYLQTIEAGNFTILVNPEVIAAAITAFDTNVVTLSDAIHQKSCVQVLASNGVAKDISEIQSIASTLSKTSAITRAYVGYFPNSINVDCEIAAGIAAVMVKQPRPGDPIDDFPIVGLNIPIITERLTTLQIQSLLLGSVTPIHVVDNTASIVEMVTAATTAAGNQKLVYFETQTALDYIRKNVIKLEKEHYKNTKNNAETRARLRNEIYAMLKLLEKPQFEITQNVDDNKDKITVVADLANPGRCNVVIPADIVVGLHVIANMIQLI